MRSDTFVFFGRNSQKDATLLLGIYSLLAHIYSHRQPINAWTRIQTLGDAVWTRLLMPIEARQANAAMIGRAVRCINGQLTLIEEQANDDFVNKLAASVLFDAQFVDRLYDTVDFRIFTPSHSSCAPR